MRCAHESASGARVVQKIVERCLPTSLRFHVKHYNSQGNGEDPPAYASEPVDGLIRMTDVRQSVYLSYEKVRQAVRQRAD